VKTLRSALRTLAGWFRTRLEPEPEWEPEMPHLCSLESLVDDLYDEMTTDEYAPCFR
jgi:hypothetical protein